MTKSRTAKSVRNIKYAVLGQIVALLISFITRYFFIRTLSVEYLGIEGLFSNILSLLSLADLGIGTAVIYSLYEPLAKDSKDKIVTLVLLYKKIFHIIGIVILILGLIITPFLEFLIKDVPDIPYLKGIFILFVINTTIPYFFADKRSLFIADQKRYITSLYRYSFFTIYNIVQIVVLLLTQNYYLFLASLLVFNFLENYLLARRAKSEYSFLDIKSDYDLNVEERKSIIQNAKGMSFHRLGGVVVNGTDNVLLSKIVSIIEVGLFSNYFLIINAITIVFSMLFQSVTASIGNLVVTESKEKSLQYFKILNYSCFWIYGVISIFIFEFINPFIDLWLGEKYLFNKSIVLILSLNFFIAGMRKSVLTYRDALGLYWQDRWKPIFESIIKIGISLFLGSRYGTIGVFIGTTVSTLTTCFWVEPYVLFKYGIKDKLSKYFKQYIYYTIIVVITSIICHYILSLIEGESILFFALKIVIATISVGVVFTLFTCKLEEFKYYINIIKAKVKGLK